MSNFIENKSGVGGAVEREVTVLNNQTTHRSTETTPQPLVGDDLNSSRSSRPDDFGDGPEQTYCYKFEDLEFTFDKNNSAGMSCISKTMRRVVITTSPNHGREIRIYSKDRKSIMPKNHIPFSYCNPIIESSDSSVTLRRSDKTTVTLNSDNNTLVQLFCNEIITHQRRLHMFRDLMWKYTHCFQSTGIRMIMTTKNTKQTAAMTRCRTLRYEKHIKTMSKHFITTALRYLTNHLQHGPEGYTYLQRYFFDRWYQEYNRNCIKESIKQNHASIQTITNLFNNGDVSRRSFRPQSAQQYSSHSNKLMQTTKIAHHVNSVNKELNEIVTSLQNITYCTNENAQNDYTDAEKITIVKNLQHLADLRHNLQTMNNEEEEFILVGDQSSGKSSLLCMLLGVNIGYTSEHFATRCPVRYLLEPCPPAQGWSYQFENPQTKDFENVTQDELQKKLTTHFEKVIGRQIVYNPITIKIWSPVCTSSMTLVDLPGLVGKGTDKIKQQQHNKSYHIVQEYLKKTNNIVMFVQRVDLDVGSLNTMILDEVQKRPADKVVYCLTHFDRLCTDKDVALEEIMRVITASAHDIACNRDMFLLSLPKRVEDLRDKEHVTHDIISKLKADYPEKFRRNTIHFNLPDLKKFLRKNIHKHVNQIEGVVYQFIKHQREILTEQTHYINKSLCEPIINDIVLEQFIDQFKKKTIKLLKGQFLPERSSIEQNFFESLKIEVYNANKYAIENNVSIWPPRDMKQRPDKKIPVDDSNCDHLESAESTAVETAKSREQFIGSEHQNDTEPLLVFENSPRASPDHIEEKSTKSDISMASVRLSIIPEVPEHDNEDYDSYFGETMDSSLQRDLVSHALFTRTIYELQLRLWSVFLSPRYQDIIYAIATDPNINLDGPKDAIYCVMTHTIKQQLSMNNFFSYAMKRLEYILYKVIRYVIWFMQNSPETSQECMILMSRPEFQAILEIEIHKYCHKLSTETYEELTKVFDEIMSAPIVVSHALRYKEMLIQNFGWTEEEIVACTQEDIFKPRPINVEKDTKQYNHETENARTESIKHLITLHIHVRLIMITEHMVRAIDFNWRRMLDDSKESTFLNTGTDIFTHIKHNVLRSVVVNGYNYKGEYLYKLYSGDEQTKLEDEKQCIEDVLTALDDIVVTCELLPNLMTSSMKIAGDKFL